MLKMANKQKPFMQQLWPHLWEIYFPIINLIIGISDIGLKNLENMILKLGLNCVYIILVQISFAF